MYIKLHTVFVKSKWLLNTKYFNSPDINRLYNASQV